MVTAEVTEEATHEATAELIVEGTVEATTGITAEATAEVPQDITVNTPAGEGGGEEEPALEVGHARHDAGEEVVEVEDTENSKGKEEAITAAEAADAKRDENEKVEKMVKLSKVVATGPMVTAGQDEEERASEVAGDAMVGVTDVPSEGVADSHVEATDNSNQRTVEIAAHDEERPLG
jgi:hypothetical protein